MPVRLVPLLVPLLLAAVPATWASAAWAQTDTPRLALPAPAVGESASVTEILRAAQTAVITGKLGEAQEALEMAQTRLLDRSVPLFQTNNASQDPSVATISLALRALADGDREAVLRHIQTATTSVDAPVR